MAHSGSPSAPLTARTRSWRGMLALPYRGRWNDALPGAVRAGLVAAYQGPLSVSAVSANILCALILAAFLGGLVDQSLIAVWLMSVTTVSILSLLANERYRRDQGRDYRPDFWASVYLSRALLNGCVWGTAAAVVPAAPGTSIGLVLIIIIVGLAASEAAMGSALAGVAASASGPMLLGLMVRALATSNEQSLPLTLGLLIGVFAAGVAAYSFAAQQTLLRIITLGRHNANLATQLARSEEYFRGMVENVSDLLMVIDGDWMITFHSPSVQHLLGHDNGALIRRRLEEIVHRADWPRLSVALDETGDGSQERLEQEVRLATRSGEWRYFHLHGGAIQSRQDSGRIILSAQDVTDQRQVRETLRLAKDRAEEAGRAKQTFLAVMSHEIRTPMSGMISLIDLLQAAGLSGRPADYVTALAEAGAHLSELLDDILDISRIDADRVELHPEPFDAGLVIRGVVDLFRARAEAKGISLRVDGGLDRAGWRLGDVRSLRQILANLLGNAVKFTETGGVLVTVVGSERDLVIAVADTGPGIAAARRERLFEPFYTADPEARTAAGAARRHSGTGLGLAISQGLARLQGGEIAVDSTPGQGACFTVRLPIPSSPAPTAAVAASRMAEAAPDAATVGGDDSAFAGVKVLIADDSPLNRLVAGDMATAVGLAVTLAADGQEALARFRENRPDLVLLDIQMPVLDGFAVAGLMRADEAWANRRRTPIIAVSATALEEDRQRALAAGCDAYIAKPLRRKTLMALLATWVAGQAPVSPFEGVEPELEPLLPRFFSHLESDLATLLAAVAAGDEAATAHTAHAIKGNAQLFGFTPLADSLQALERAILDPAAALVAVGREVEVLRTAYRQQAAAPGHGAAEAPALPKSE